MARSLSEEENIGRRGFSTGSIDEEIAELLSAIEEEKVPAQLQELALKLQAALASKKACQTAN